MRRFAFLSLAFTALLPALRAQDTDGPVKMEPELPLIIPLTREGPHKVTVKYPILINMSTVVRPGMALRVLYIPPVQEDSENLVVAHMGTMAESFSRGSGETGPHLPPEIAHEIERQRRIVWEVPLNFQLTLAQQPTDQLHLIYSTSGDNRNLDDERLNFFDGLFLGSPHGGVTVLAVEKDSKADKAGLKAGDQILAVSGKTVPEDLAAFPALYVAARKEAQDAGAPDYTFTVRSSGAASGHPISMSMPPSLKNQLMNGF